MKKSVLMTIVCAIALIFTACGSDPFIGEWTMDVEKSIEVLSQGKDISNGKKEAALKMADAIKISFVFTSDGKMIVEVGMGENIRKGEGTWVLESKDGDVYKLKTTLPSYNLPFGSKSESIELKMDGANLVMGTGDGVAYLKKK